MRLALVALTVFASSFMLHAQTPPAAEKPIRFVQIQWHHLVDGKQKSPFITVALYPDRVVLIQPTIDKKRPITEERPEIPYTAITALEVNGSTLNLVDLGFMVQTTQAAQWLTIKTADNNYYVLKTSNVGTFRLLVAELQKRVPKPVTP